MHITIDFQDDDYQRIIEQLSDSRNVGLALASVGEALVPINLDRHERAVNPDETPWEPLKPSTKARKTKPYPLRESGEMLSIHYQVSGDTLKIGSSDWKAKWHHFGTGPFTIKPKQARVLLIPGVGFRAKAEHPGLPAREIVGFDRADREAAENAIADFYDEILNQV